MIAERIPARGHGRRGSFEACRDYVWGISGDRPTHQWSWGVASIETAPYEMEVLASRSRCRDPVEHWVISYATGERPSPDMMGADVERFLATNDMAGHQCVAAAHPDTDHLHVHVVANRVGSDTRASACSYSAVRTERMCAEIALERGWTIVAGRHNRDLVGRQAAQPIDRVDEPALPTTMPYRASERQVQRLARSGELPWAETARPAIVAAAAAATSWAAFGAALAQSGIVLKHTVKRGAGGREFHGLAFAEELAVDAPGCSASAISSDLRYAALQARFGPHPEQVESPAVTALEPNLSASPQPAIGQAASLPGVQADTGSPRTWLEDEKARASPRPILVEPVVAEAGMWPDGHPQERGSGAASPAREHAHRAFMHRYKQYHAAEQARIRAASASDLHNAWDGEKIVRAASRQRSHRTRAVAREVVFLLGFDPIVRRYLLNVIQGFHRQRLKRERDAAHDRWIAQRRVLGQDATARPLPFSDWLKREAATDAAAARHMGWVDGLIRRQAESAHPQGDESNRDGSTLPSPIGSAREGNVGREAAESDGAIPQAKPTMAPVASGNLSINVTPDLLTSKQGDATGKVGRSTEVDRVTTLGGKGSPAPNRDENTSVGSGMSMSSPTTAIPAPMRVGESKFTSTISPEIEACEATHLEGHLHTGAGEMVTRSGPHSEDKTKVAETASISGSMDAVRAIETPSTTDDEAHRSQKEAFARTTVAEVVANEPEVATNSEHRNGMASGPDYGSLPAGQTDDGAEHDDASSSNESSARTKEVEGAAREEGRAGGERRRLVGSYAAVLIGRKWWTAKRGDCLAASIQVSRRDVWLLALDVCQNRYGHRSPTKVGAHDLAALRTEVNVQATDAGFDELLRLMQLFTRPPSGTDKGLGR